MSAHKLKEQIAALITERDALAAKLQAQTDAAESSNKEHATELGAKQQSHEVELEKTRQEYETKISTLIGEAAEREGNLKISLAQKEKDLEEKQSALDRKELKKLAQAFYEEERGASDDQKRWLAATLGGGILLLVVVVLSIIWTSGWPWVERLVTTPIDLLLVSVVWFCSAQYRDASRRKYDYANRKTIAQSFNNILNNLPEDEAIRSKFSEKSTDVLCSPSTGGTSEPILTKKVFADAVQLVSMVAKGRSV